MNKQEFYSASLTTGLKLKSVDGSIGLLTSGYCVSGEFSYEWCVRTNLAKPIVRPLSDLTKPITQANYNNGKPFVPIIELAKIAIVRQKSPMPFKVENHIGGLLCCCASDDYFWVKENGSLGYSFITDKKEHLIFIENQLQLFQQLLKWHFWPDMPEGEEVIYVSEEFNPYK